MRGVSFTHPVLALFVIWGVSLTHPMLALNLCGEFLLHIPRWIPLFFLMGGISLTHPILALLLSGEFLLHIPCLLFLCGEFLLHIPCLLFLCGEFLLHIPCWIHFFLGSFSYTSHDCFIFYVGSFSYTSHADFFFFFFFFLFLFYFIFYFFNLRSFSYTSHVSFFLSILMWRVFLGHPILAFFSSGEFLFHISRWLYFYLGSFYYRSHACFCVGGVSLTHPMLFCCCFVLFLLFVFLSSFSLFL